MNRICVVGTGYVGLVTGACLADLGNSVVCLDINEQKIALLQQGTLPIYEPGLDELVRRNVQAERLSFTSSYSDAVGKAQFIFMAVDTPSGAEGEANVKQIRAAASSVARALTGAAIIVNKSTVPIGTGDVVAEIVHSVNPACEFAVVSNPEFLREGSAIADFLQPDRIVLGSTDRAAAKRVEALYAPLNAPVIITDLRTAEMIKYASNAFLATKISFINEIAAICEQLGADVKEVARGMGLDRRVGSAFLDAGLGFGGSCFPKDVKALAHMAAVHGCHPQLLRAVLEINRDQRRSAVQRLRHVLGSFEGRTIGLLGLAFKPNTDDMREAPSVELIHLLQHEGATIRVYDPAAMSVAARLLPDVTLCSGPYQVADGSDALIVVTDWNEFKQLDMAAIRRLLRHPVLFDGRNIYDPDQMAELGFIYFGVGRAQSVGFRHASILNGPVAITSAI